jgi:hypothetical protein
VYEDDDYEEWLEEWEIPLDDPERCDWCGRVHPLRMQCDSSLFDADELGLDPEDDRGESR